jgi:hypothetical protein
MVILFEDNANTPTSILLSKSVLGEYMHFANGGPNVQSCIYKYLNEDLVFVFFDLVPDNEITLTLYNNLCDTFRSNSNVLILPVLCREYSVLLWLYRYFPELTKLVDDVESLVLNTDFLTLRNQLGVKSSEKLCKAVLHEFYKKHHNAACFLNVSTTKSTRAGDFYTKSCPCNNIYCKLSFTNMSLTDKADSLYSNLPFYPSNFLVKNKEVSLGISFSTYTDFDTVLQVHQSFYDKLCAVLNEQNIDITRRRLI